MNLFVFVLNSVLLGIGLAMDAFSVSIANGLREPAMSRRRMLGIAGTYAAFQFGMPMIGWVCVRTVAEHFKAFQKLIPWIALLLLLYIGGKMVVEGTCRKNPDDDGASCPITRLGLTTLLLQGVATSIDALSVGFTIADYHAGSALVCSLIIAAVTLAICMAGLLFGRKVGERFSEKATVAGGLILIGIGLEIFIKGVIL